MEVKVLGLEEAIEEIGFDEVMKSIMSVARPNNLLDRLEMIHALMESLSVAVVWDAHWHVEDHEGYVCAKNIIDGIPKDLHKRMNDLFCEVLQDLGKQTPPKSHNEQLAEELLKEIESDG